MVDKRTLEFALSDQKEEMEEYAQETLCQRCEEQQIDLDSTQAQVVIGVRRSGKSTLCYQTLRDKGVKYAYANFDDEQLFGLKASDLNDVLEVLYKIYGDFNYLFTSHSHWLQCQPAQRRIGYPSLRKEQGGVAVPVLVQGILHNEIS